MKRPGALFIKSLSQLTAAEKPQVPRTAIVIGGGIIGISSALQLARRGVAVTVLEESQDVSQVASYRNGAIICQSMAASWASANLIAANPGELKSVRLSWRALTDPSFYVWAGWFWFNSLWPGRAEYNHQSCRLLAWLRSSPVTTWHQTSISLSQLEMSAGRGARVRDSGGDEQDRRGDDQAVPRQD